MKIEPKQKSISRFGADMQLLHTPEPPYVAVISTNIFRNEDGENYDKAMQKLLELARDFPGFLGIELASHEQEDGQLFKLAVVYWKDMAALDAWRRDERHMAIKRKGKAKWYDEHNIRVCEVREHYGANLTQGKSTALAYQEKANAK